MNICTIRTQIRNAPSLWDQQYKNFNDPKKIEIGKTLKQLDVETATPEDLEKIIGNSLWAQKQQCEECGSLSETLIGLGNQDVGTSQQIYVCKPCLKNALKMIDSELKSNK